MRTETKWAIIGALALFVILLIEKFSGLFTAGKAGFGTVVSLALAIITLLLICLMTVWEKREKELNGFISWQEGFWATAIMILIFIPLSTLLVYFFLHFIDTNAAGMLMAASGDHSGKDAANNFLWLHLINTFCMGLIFAFAFPFFMKKDLE